MLLVYLGFYTFALVLVWWLFIVSRLHSYKFKNFSNHIVKVTNALFVFLLTLSIIGYVFIFMNYESNQNIQLNFWDRKIYPETNY